VIAAGLPPPCPSPPPPPSQLGELPTVWALKPPNDTPLHPVKVTRGLLCIKTTYAPMIYTSLCVMIFGAGTSITWASGRWLGPGNPEFFGSQMALAYRLDAISQGLKNSCFPGPNPLPLALVMYLTHRKHFARGRINHRCINSYCYVHKPFVFHTQKLLNSDQYNSSHLTRDERKSSNILHFDFVINQQ
jgi:hypothetical protein